MPTVKSRKGAKQVKNKPIFQISVKCVDEGDYKDTGFIREAFYPGIPAENFIVALHEAAAPYEPTHADCIRKMNNENMAHDRVHKSAFENGHVFWYGDFEGYAITEEKAIKLELDWLQQLVCDTGE